MATGHPSDERLLAAYRVIRRVTPPEHPWRGLLARAGDDSLVLVPAEELGEDWPGWGANGDGHVITPIDIVRRADGHDVVMPPCPHRLADIVARRRDDGRPLDAGEAVTVAVSILRGVDELRSLGPNGSGEWWITEGGMPVLAAGAAFERSGAQEGADILRGMLPCDPAVDDVLEDVITALPAPETGARTLVQLESRLFACAEPAALAVASPSPKRVWAGDAPALDRDVVVESPRGLFERLAHHVDADLAEVISTVTTTAWRRFTRSRTSGRRRPVLVGAAIAGVVIAGGLLWPGSDGPRPAEAVATAPTTAPSDVASGMPTTVPSDVPTDAAMPEEDLAAIASDLLTRRAECAGDSQCLAGAVEDPAALHPAGVVDLAASQRTVTLLDAFGGAAVLRVDAIAGSGSGSAPQFVVIIAREGRWLIRDVHDVADQP